MTAISITTRPEKSRLKLGFIALADAAPLVVADTLGFFEAEGLDVQLLRQSSWAAIRDKVALGLLDGAQMLAGLPLASTLGLGIAPLPMCTALSLGLNGNAITLGDTLWQRLETLDPRLAEGRLGEPAGGGAITADVLRRLIQADRKAGLAPLTFAMVHPFSSHNYQLRLWLASAGIDPDRDVRLIVVPPDRVVANLRAQRIAGFCVGAPWSELAVADGLGHIAITGYELWNNAPEKVLGVARDWSESYPNTHAAMVRGVLRACQWLDVVENRRRIAPLVASAAYIDCDADLLAASYAGDVVCHPNTAPRHNPDHCVFHRHAANFPWRSHALWFLQQMQRWGQLHPATDIHAVANVVYRPDLYRQVCATLDITAPAFDYKCEGGHADSWRPPEQPDLLLGADRFFDAGRFDPQQSAPSPRLPRSISHADLQGASS